MAGTVDRWLINGEADVLRWLIPIATFALGFFWAGSRVRGLVNVKGSDASSQT